MQEVQNRLLSMLKEGTNIEIWVIQWGRLVDRKDG